MEADCPCDFFSMPFFCGTLSNCGSYKLSGGYYYAAHCRRRPATRENSLKTVFLWYFGPESENIFWQKWQWLWGRKGKKPSWK
jgi:hypothetical protein